MGSNCYVCSSIIQEQPYRWISSVKHLPYGTVLHLFYNKKNNLKFSKNFDFGLSWEWKVGESMP